MHLFFVCSLGPGVLQDLSPKPFGGLQEFTPGSYRLQIADVKEYNCTVPLHWLGMHQWAHRARGLPSWGHVERVFTPTFLDESGNLTLRNLTGTRVRIRSESPHSYPKNGCFQFVDGDAIRLAFLLALARSFSSSESRDLMLTAARPPT